MKSIIVFHLGWVPSKDMKRLHFYFLWEQINTGFMLYKKMPHYSSYAHEQFLQCYTYAVYETAKLMNPEFCNILNAVHHSQICYRYKCSESNIFCIVLQIQNLENGPKHLLWQKGRRVVSLKKCNFGQIDVVMVWFSQNKIMIQYHRWRGNCYFIVPHQK